MKVGSTSVTITANSQAQLMNVTTAAKGEVIEETEVKQLPLPTRNFQQLLALTPGAVASLSNNTELGRGDAYMAVNGQRMTSNIITINGAEIVGGGTNSSLNSAVPAPDTIQQFVVQTSLFDATSGRNSGGNVAVITKSGSNDFHGSFYEFLRNRALNANDFFLNGRGHARPVLTRNQFGNTLGGRIVQNRAFFFISYQGTRERNGASLSNSITTPNLPAGLTQDRSTEALHELAEAFGVHDIHPVSLALLQARLPDGDPAIPNAGSEAASPTTAVPTPLSTLSRFQEDQFNTNFDLELGASNRLAAKFFFSSVKQYQGIYNVFGTNPFQAPGYGGNANYRNWVLTLSDTHIFGSRIVNQLTYGFNRAAGTFAPEEPFTNAQFGITNPLSAEEPGLATIGVTGMFTIGSTALAEGEAAGRIHNWSNTLSWSRGRQIMTLGGRVRHSLVDNTFQFYSRGTVLFNNFTDFLSGNTAAALLGNGVRDRAPRMTDFDVFFQNDIRLTEGFNLNAGLRMERNGGISGRSNRLVAFNPEAFHQNSLPCTPTDTCYPPNGLTLLSAGQTLTPDTLHLAPRLGFAWSPTRRGRLVIRGGFGVYFDRFSMRTAIQQMFSYPLAVVGTGLAGSFFSNPFPDLSGMEFPLNPVIPSPVPYYAGGVPYDPGHLRTPISGFFVDSNFRTPYVYSYSFGLQWQPATHYSVQFDYVGNKGTKLINVRTLNQGVGDTAPYTASGFSNNKILNGLQMAETSATSHYDSLQAALRRRSGSMLFLLSYTFSKSIDEGSGAPTNELIALPGDQQIRALQRGPSDFDRTHRFLANFVYDLPRLYSGASRLSAEFLNGWQFSGIITAQSGIPFSVISTSGATVYNRADLLRPGNGAKTGPVKQSLDAYFDSSAFAVSLATTPPFGTSPRNLLRGPSQKSVDFSIIKVLRVTESNRIEFRAEFFNLFNTVNFSLPNNNMSVPGTVARITSTSSGPRVLQFALKYGF
jgi:hypothetical protein